MSLLHPVTLSFETEEIKASQLYRDNERRVLVKVMPRRIRAWDFSKAPIGRR